MRKKCWWEINSQMTPRKIYEYAGASVYLTRVHYTNTTITCLRIIQAHFLPFLIKKLGQICSLSFCKLHPEWNYIEKNQKNWVGYISLSKLIQVRKKSYFIIVIILINFEKYWDNWAHQMSKTRKNILSSLPKAPNEHQKIIIIASIFGKWLSTSHAQMKITDANEKKTYSSNLK